MKGWTLICLNLFHAESFFHAQIVHPQTCLQNREKETPL